MAKNPGHRPRRNTPEQVEKAVDKAIMEYQETGDIGKLTDYNILQILGNITVDTLERYYNGKADEALFDDPEFIQQDNEREEEYKKRGYSVALKRLVEYRRNECVRHIASGGASTSITGWIFLSKQPHWGGFQDVQRYESKGQQSINIQISGPDGKALKE